MQTFIVYDDLFAYGTGSLVECFFQLKSRKGFDFEIRDEPEGRKIPIVRYKPWVSEARQYRIHVNHTNEEVIRSIMPSVCRDLGVRIGKLSE